MKTLSTERGSFYGPKPRGFRFSAGLNAVLVSNPYRESEGEAALTRGWTVKRPDTMGRICAILAAFQVVVFLIAVGVI